MIEIISHIDVGAVPCPGVAGHMAGAKLRDKISQVINLERLKIVAASGCPVNKKIPTTMTKDSFVRACNTFREIAEKDRNRKGKFAISTLTGFKSNNRRMCLDCDVGEKVKEEEPFKPPSGITFCNLKDIVVRPLIIHQVQKKEPIKEKPVTKRLTRTKPTTKRIKLTKEDVIRIRQMHAEGYTVPGLCEIFPVATSTMYRVVNYESWRDVK